MGNIISCAVIDDGNILLKAAEEGNLGSVGSVLLSDARYLRYRSCLGGNTAWHKAAKNGQLPVLTHMADFVRAAFDQGDKDLEDPGQAAMQRWGSTPQLVLQRLVNGSNCKVGVSQSIQGRFTVVPATVSFLKVIS